MDEETSVSKGMPFCIRVYKYILQTNCTKIFLLETDQKVFEVL